MSYLQLMNNLDFLAAIDELKQAAAYLRSTGAQRVGCIGFCMGGALTLAAAQHAGVDAAQAFYGIPGKQICQPEAIKVPAYLHIGALDHMIGFSDVKVCAWSTEARCKCATCKCVYACTHATCSGPHSCFPPCLPVEQTAETFQADVNKAGGSAQLHVYPDCGHAFLNVGKDAVALRTQMGFPEPPAAQQAVAWQAVLAFFEEHLKV